MGSLRELNPSLWVATTADSPTLPAPEPECRFEVVVVGGGIAGLTTGRLLAAEGRAVGVVEAGPLAAGATGYTTAKITALQATAVSEIASQLGVERAAAYAAANAAAVERVAELVDRDEIDCDFVRAPACTYASKASEVEAVEAEHAAASAAGLPTRLGLVTELPFQVPAAVWLDDQAQFHPRRYCLGLAAAAARDGASVFEHTRALDVVERAGGCVGCHPIDSGPRKARPKSVRTRRYLASSSSTISSRHGIAWSETVICESPIKRGT